MSKVYVVVDEFYGTIADVNVYKNIRSVFCS